MQPLQSFYFFVFVFFTQLSNCSDRLTRRRVAGGVLTKEDIQLLTQDITILREDITGLRDRIDTLHTLLQNEPLPPKRTCSCCELTYTIATYAAKKLLAAIAIRTLLESNIE